MPESSTLGLILVHFPSILNKDGLVFPPLRRVKLVVKMLNPDFPAPMSQKLFVLDFDAYYHGPQDYDDLVKNIDIFHERIQELFENLIKGPLREKMQ